MYGQLQFILIFFFFNISLTQFEIIKKKRKQKINAKQNIYMQQKWCQIYGSTKYKTHLFSMHTLFRIQFINIASAIEFQRNENKKK